MDDDYVEPGLGPLAWVVFGLGTTLQILLMLFLLANSEWRVGGGTLLVDGAACALAYSMYGRVLPQSRPFVALFAGLGASGYVVAPVATYFALMMHVSFGGG